MKLKKNAVWPSILSAAVAIFLGSIFLADSLAQEDEYLLAHESIFGELRRSPVTFPHERHIDALENEGCGACHHSEDAESGRVVYVEGEELGCWECHGREKDNGIPALQGAYHGNCTACHRKLIKQNSVDSGPTTCGGCHLRQ